jgi:hypothetical protein
MDGGMNGLGSMVDWSEIGLSLRRLGYGPSAVARALNLPPRTVLSWFNEGCEPRYSNGVMLIRLYSRLEQNARRNFATL